MPDSFQSQPDGPSSHDDRVLDSLLSGDTSDIAASLRPVADTLNALRAAPSARELRGEAAARAQFRALRQAEFTGAAEPRTLDLPVVPTQRHRSAPVRAVRRRPGWTRLAGLVTVAAVLVLAIAITYTGNLPGGLQHIAHDTIAAPPGRSAPQAATNGMQATSARPVAPSTAASPASVPAPSVPSPVSPGDQGKKALCDQFWSDLTHAQPGRVSWQTPRYRQLVAAAHGAELASVAIAWLLAKPNVTAPIASATSPEQLESLTAAVTLELTPDEIAALDEASSPA